MYLVTWPSCAYLADVFLSYLTTPGGGDDLKRRPNLMPDVPGPCDGPSLGSRVLFASKSRYSGQSGRVVRVLPKTFEVESQFDGTVRVPKTSVTLASKEGALPNQESRLVERAVELSRELVEVQLQLSQMSMARTQHCAHGNRNNDPCLDPGSAPKKRKAGSAKRDARAATGNAHPTKGAAPPSSALHHPATALSTTLHRPPPPSTLRRARSSVAWQKALPRQHKEKAAATLRRRLMSRMSRD